MSDHCGSMSITWTGRPEADQLLETDPLALLIGLVLDQQVKMEKAFSGPYDLKERLGHLDPAKIASMDPQRLDELFRQRPALHRFPANKANGSWAPMHPIPPHEIRTPPPRFRGDPGICRVGFCGPRSRIY